MLEIPISLLKINYMPVYVYFSNLLVLKSAVEQKYSGGIPGFRHDYAIGEDNNNQEDRELFSISTMNSDEQDIFELVSKGLHYDYENHCSDDFVILPRYGDFFWSAPWAKHNGVFAWHVEADEASVSKARKISEEMTVEDIAELFDQGENLFAAIW